MPSPNPATAPLNWFESSASSHPPRNPRAYLALSAPALPSSSVIASTLSSRGIAARACPPSPAPHAASVALGSVTVHWRFVEAPMPLTHQPCGCEVTRDVPALREQVAHLELTGTGDDASPADVAWAITRVIVALAQHVAAVGVAFDSAAAAMSPKRFVDFVKRASDANLPALLWIRVAIVTGPEGLTVYSDGLEAFGRPEIEVRMSKAPFLFVMRRVESMIEYVVRTQAHLRPGDFFGIADDEKFPLRHARSQCHADRRIVCVLGI
jgi:hypothetical protein